jgi:hypothetical protein
MVIILGKCAISLQEISEDVKQQLGRGVKSSMPKYLSSPTYIHLNAQQPYRNVGITKKKNGISLDVFETLGSQVPHIVRNFPYLR